MRQVKLPAKNMTKLQGYFDRKINDRRTITKNNTEKTLSIFICFYRCAFVVVVQIRRNDVLQANCVLVWFINGAYIICMTLCIVHDAYKFFG